MAQNLCKVPIMELSSGTIFDFFVNETLRYRVSFTSDSGRYYRRTPFKSGSQIVYTPGVRLHGCPLMVWVNRCDYVPALWFDRIHKFCADNDDNWYYRWQRVTRLAHFRIFGLFVSTWKVCARRFIASLSN